MLRSVTTAPGTTLPEGSRTVPSTTAVSNCAPANEARHATSIAILSKRCIQVDPSWFVITRRYHGPVRGGLHTRELLLRIRLQSATRRSTKGIDTGTVLTRPP